MTRVKLARLVGFAFVAMSLSCGPGGSERAPQPLPLRAICAVERWLRWEDNRVREPGSSLCDAEGVKTPRIPGPDAPDEPEGPSHEEPERRGS